MIVECTRCALKYSGEQLITIEGRYCICGGTLAHTAACFRESKSARLFGESLDAHIIRMLKL